MKSELVALDAGRNGIKVVRNGSRDYFRAAVAPHRDLNLERKIVRNDMTVQFGGEKFFVGDIAHEESIGGTQMMLASKAHRDTLILTLTALHRLFSGDDRIFIMTGVPVETPEKDEKQRLKLLLYGTHRICVNEQWKTFHIERVEVATEAATTAWALRRGDAYVIVDVGSRTVNYATMRNYKWVDIMSGTLDYGLDSVGIMTPAQFSRMVIADLSRRLRTLPKLILIGGMAHVLAEEFKRYTPDVEVHPDPLYANAMSYYELGVQAIAQAKT